MRIFTLDTMAALYEDNIVSSEKQPTLKPALILYIPGLQVARYELHNTRRMSRKVLAQYKLENPT